MPQLTVRLPHDVDQALGAAAERLQRKRAEIVRMALRRFLGLERAGKPADGVRSLLGSVTSGVPDLAERHREYIVESLKRDS